MDDVAEAASCTEEDLTRTAPDDRLKFPSQTQVHMVNLFCQTAVLGVPTPVGLIKNTGRLTCITENTINCTSC